MCAIHGIGYRNVGDMDRMLAVAHHRGPDHKQSWHDTDITLGHNLLSIVDDELNSHQPWVHHNLVLVFNGEIYNYKELKLGLNYDWQTDTDTELLAVGLHKHGKDFLEKLDGMFGLALYNTETKELVLARDCNGTKPVYYGFLDGKLCFSSEIKSLLHLGFDRRICKRALSHYYNSGYNAGYLTMFEGIKKLVPGEVQTYRDNKLINKTNLNDVPLPSFLISKNENDVAVELRERLNKSVEMTLMGRRNIGLFLSGGIDSSSILYEMCQLETQPKTFTSHFATIDPSSRLNLDSDLAKTYCEMLGVQNHRVHQTQQDYVDALEPTFYALEEPRQGKSFPTYYNTNKFLSENNITVTLAGDGGDEVLVGYKHHKFPDWHGKLKSLSRNNRPLSNSELICTADDQIEYLNEWLPQKNMKMDDLNNFMYIECLNSLCDDFLIRNDKLGMAFSMEGRFPIMMKHFTDYVRQIPSAMKKGPEFDKNPLKYNKHLYKLAYKNRLPDVILNHKKTGWRFPTDEILIGSRERPAPDNSLLKDYIREILKDKELREIFEFNDDDVENRYLNNRDHPPKGSRKKADIGLLSQKELFLTLNFAIWKKVFKVSI
jgi:asparagine synthase (glutamine-hydrolysing)